MKYKVQLILELEVEAYDFYCAYDLTKDLVKELDERLPVWDYQISYLGEIEEEKER
jgi:hypothetical protein